MSDVDNVFDNFGIKTESSKEIVNNISGKLRDEVNTDEKLTPKPLLTDLTHDNRYLAYQKNLIPKSYMDAKFDETKIRSNVSRQYNKEKGLYLVYKFNNYISVCNDVLSTFRMGMLPDKSYLIGAPQRFGKQAFISECIMTMTALGFKAVPYISLWELAQIRVENEKTIMNPYRKYKEEDSKREDTYYTTQKKYNEQLLKEPNAIQYKYTYSEYINADCAFVFFTDVISKDIESHTLYQFLTIRATKGLPTIVMISTSLDPYLNDKFLRETVFDAILESNSSDCGLDRLHYVSCYRMKNLLGKEITNDEGVVND